MYSVVEQCIVLSRESGQKLSTFHSTCHSTFHWTSVLTLPHCWRSLARTNDKEAPSALLYYWQEKTCQWYRKQLQLRVRVLDFVYWGGQTLSTILDNAQKFDFDQTSLYKAIHARLHYTRWLNALDISLYMNVERCIVKSRERLTRA